MITKEYLGSLLSHTSGTAISIIGPRTTAATPKALTLVLTYFSKSILSHISVSGLHANISPRELAGKHTQLLAAYQPLTSYAAEPWHRACESLHQHVR